MLMNYFNKLQTAVSRHREPTENSDGGGERMMCPLFMRNHNETKHLRTFYIETSLPVRQLWRKHERKPTESYRSRGEFELEESNRLSDRVRQSSPTAQTSFRQWAEQLEEGGGDSTSRRLAIFFGMNISVWPFLAILNSFATNRDWPRMAQIGGSTNTHGVSPERMMGKLEPLLPKPDPGIVTMVMVAFGAGASTMYHLNRDDELQDKILAAGITLAFMSGILLGYDAEAIILSILPWAILLVLSLSAVGHGIYRYMAWIPESCESDIPVWNYT